MLAVALVVLFAALGEPVVEPYYDGGETAVILRWKIDL